MEELNKIKIELLVYRIIIFVLICMSAIFGYWQYKSNKIELVKAMKDTDFPYYNTIMEIMRPLEYSAFGDLNKPGVTVSIDSNKRTWTLRNIHQYDQQGCIILDDFRYGLCGELADYVSHRLKPIIRDKYKIQFVRAAESGFFLAPNATHIVLLLTEMSSQKSYLIDPSLHRYGPAEDMEEYLFFNSEDKLDEIERKEKDVTFAMDHGTPLFIRNDFLLSLIMENCDGKFDRDNFIISIRANRRYRYSNRYIFAIRISNGKAEFFENTLLINQVLTPEELTKLRNKIVEWSENIYKRVTSSNIFLNTRYQLS